MDSDNQVVLGGTITEIGLLRYTPAGVPVLEFRISHASTQTEAGLNRRVECEVQALAMAETAQRLARLKTGDVIRAEGFLARKTRMSQYLVLHVINAQIEQTG